MKRQINYSGNSQADSLCVAYLWQFRRAQTDTFGFIELEPHAVGGRLRNAIA